MVPSHVAGIQLRRRLAAEHGPFAGVRFETLPRLAELLGAGDLAQAGKSPLARPIGDYLAAEVARDATGVFYSVRDLPGFARVLRQTFRRLRRGGYRPGDQIPVLAFDSRALVECVRLHGLYLDRTSSFYDDEDLQDAAAASVDRRREAVALELGEVYVLPPGAMSAAADRLLTSIRRAVGRGHYHEVSDEGATATSRFVLAPDPASEVREVTREVVDALSGGLGLHEIGVFHGADPAYRALLSQAFESAGIPVNALPGPALSETAAGRGVLMLAELPIHNYARTQVIDWLSLAPLRDFLPTSEGNVPAMAAPWRRLAREAGITQGAARWQSGLDALETDLEARIAEAEEDVTRRARYEDRRAHIGGLRSLIQGLVERLEPLRTQQPASAFIAAFKAIVAAYMDKRSPAYDAVIDQIEQLGTIDKVGGQFTLESFASALRANLDAAHHREGALGDGIFVADYRLAAGLSFKHAILCGAYEGVFPSGAAAEALVADAIWHDLRNAHPMIEDAALRLERAQAEARRAVASAAERVTWCAPLQASGAGREHYPAQLLVAAARELDASITSATELRRASARDWLRKPPSPTAALLTGTPLDLTELRVRRSVTLRREGAQLAADHPLVASQRLLAARRAERFSDYDGNLGLLAGDALFPRGNVSPTSLETYATCGFRYFLGHVLRLRPPEEPEDRETMDAAERGTLVHGVLDEFFQRRTLEPFEAWTEEDHAALLEILDRRMNEARARGKTGLDIYAQHELRRLRADLSSFLDEDTLFRAQTGAVPRHFEKPLPQDTSSAISMRGYVDRIDLTPDGRKAWIIDYKTGRAYEGMTDEDPLMGGTRLQLPAYMAAAAEAEEITPLYWFITTAGGFTRKPFTGSEVNMQRYRDTLDAIVAGVREGAFPPVPGEEDTRFGGWANCRYCDFNRLCSRRRDDEHLAKYEDTSLRPWFGVGEAARRQAQ